MQKTYKNILENVKKQFKNILKMQRTYKKKHIKEMQKT